MENLSGNKKIPVEKQTFKHAMFVSIFSNWTGQANPRNVKIEGNLFHLRSASPLKLSGKLVMSYPTWNR